MPHFSPERAIQRWLSRPVRTSGVRRVPELPMSIASDIGTKRKENQDKAVVFRAPDPNRQQTTLVGVVLADGMGGMEAGSEASAIAISSFIARCQQKSRKSLRNRIEEAALQANSDVHTTFEGKGGCTLSTIVSTNQGTTAYLNVGDSRIYDYSHEQLRRLTIDDNIRERFQNDSANTSYGNELLQYIGMGDDLIPHTSAIDLNSSGSFILTSDGAHYIGDVVLSALLENSSSLPIFASRSLDVAKWLGSTDNISVITINPSDLWSKKENLAFPETLELWDAFGDIQIALPDLPNKSFSQATTKSRKTSENNDNGDDKTCRQKTGKRSLEDDDKAPQLRIDLNYEEKHEGDSK